MPELKRFRLEESLSVVEQCVEVVMHPVVDQQASLALDYLCKIQKMLNRLMVPEPVV